MTFAAGLGLPEEQAQRWCICHPWQVWVWQNLHCCHGSTWSMQSAQWERCCHSQVWLHVCVFAHACLCKYMHVHAVSIAHGGSVMMWNVVMHLFSQHHLRRCHMVLKETTIQWWCWCAECDMFWLGWHLRFNLVGTIPDCSTMYMKENVPD